MGALGSGQAGIARPVDLPAPCVGRHRVGAVELAGVGEDVQRAHAVHTDPQRVTQCTRGDKPDPQPRERARADADRNRRELGGFAAGGGEHGRDAWR
jgi:hypothetical protein